MDLTQVSYHKGGKGRAVDDSNSTCWSNNQFMDDNEFSSIDVSSYRQSKSSSFNDNSLYQQSETCSYTQSNQTQLTCDTGHVIFDNDLLEWLDCFAEDDNFSASFDYPLSLSSSHLPNMDVVEENNCFSIHDDNRMPHCLLRNQDQDHYSVSSSDNSTRLETITSTSTFERGNNAGTFFGPSSYSDYGHGYSTTSTSPSIDVFNNTSEHTGLYTRTPRPPLNRTIQSADASAVVNSSASGTATALDSRHWTEDDAEQLIHHPTDPVGKVNININIELIYSCLLVYFASLKPTAYLI